jgi:acyl carrier protein
MNLLNELQDVFRKIFDDDEIILHEKMTAEHIEDWDSLMHINLIIAIEKEFNVQFTTKDVMGLENVGQFLKILEKKIS